MPERPTVVDEGRIRAARAMLSCPADRFPPLPSSGDRRHEF
ncbi:hypothetical protein ACWGPD_01990 [Streptomyces hirsutus]